MVQQHTHHSTVGARGVDRELQRAVAGTVFDVGIEAEPEHLGNVVHVAHRYGGV